MLGATFFLHILEVKDPDVSPTKSYLNQIIFCGSLQSLHTEINAVLLDSTFYSGRT